MQGQMIRRNIGILTVTVIVGVLFFALPSSQCRNPIFMGNEATSPQEIMARHIAEWGGLPREDTGLGAVELARTPLYPVVAWHISKMSVHATEGQPLFDDDPTYGVTAEIEATYQDGSRARLQWDWWQYGEVRCPFVIHVGDGPPGMMKVLEVSPP
jgi:hypothetical protein